MQPLPAGARGDLLASGERYPIVQVLAQHLSAERVVVLGNRANPTSAGAQGFNLGLRDALALAELIEAGRGSRRPACCPPTWRGAIDREQAVGFSGGLARITAQSSPLLRPLRQRGFLAAHTPRHPDVLVGGALKVSMAMCRSWCRSGCMNRRSKGLTLR